MCCLCIEGLVVIALKEGEDSEFTKEIVSDAPMDYAQEAQSIEEWLTTNAASNFLPHTLAARLLEDSILQPDGVRWDERRALLQSRRIGLEKALSYNRACLPSAVAPLFEWEALTEAGRWVNALKTPEPILRWARVVLTSYMDKYCDRIQLSHCLAPDRANQPDLIVGSCEEESYAALQEVEGQTPQLIFALAWIARFDPASDLIPQIVMAQLRVRMGFSGENLWLQRRAFLYAVATYGIAFFIAYAKHCDCLEHWGNASARPVLIYYGVVKTKPSLADCEFLLNELSQYRFPPDDLGQVALHHLLREICDRHYY